MRDDLTGPAGFSYRVGEDGDQATGPQYPLAGRIQQARIRICACAAVAAGGRAAGVAQAVVTASAALGVGIPKAGITFTFSALAGCTVIAAPSGAASVTGAYDDMSTVKFVNAPIPIAGSGCTTSANATMNGTYVISPGFHDVS